MKRKLILRLLVAMVVIVDCCVGENDTAASALKKRIQKTKKNKPEVTEVREEYEGKSASVEDQVKYVPLASGEDKVMASESVISEEVIKPNLTTDEVKTENIVVEKEVKEEEVAVGSEVQKEMVVVGNEAKREKVTHGNGTIRRKVAAKRNEMKRKKVAMDKNMNREKIVVDEEANRETVFVDKKVQKSKGTTVRNEMKKKKVVVDKDVENEKVVVDEEEKKGTVTEDKEVQKENVAVRNEAEREKVPFVNQVKRDKVTVDKQVENMKVAVKIEMKRKKVALNKGANNDKVVLNAEESKRETVTVEKKVTPAVVQQVEDEKEEETVEEPKERIVTEWMLFRSGVPVDYSYSENVTNAGDIVSVPGCPKSVDGYPWVLYGKPHPQCYLVGQRSSVCEGSSLMNYQKGSEYGVCSCNFQECLAKKGLPLTPPSEGDLLGNSNVLRRRNGVPGKLRYRFCRPMGVTCEEFVYDQKEKRCDIMFSQSYCKEGQWLQRNIKGGVECAPRLCDDGYGLSEKSETMQRAYGNVTKENAECCRPWGGFAVASVITAMNKLSCDANQIYSETLNKCLTPFKMSGLIVG